MIPTLGFSQTRTVTTHNISSDVISLMPDIRYSFELGLGGSFTTLFSGGIMGLYLDTKLESARVYGPNVFLSVEPRYYYNLERRAWRGRITDRNSADFVSLDLHPILWPLSKRRIWVEEQVIASAVWGLRRVYGHFMLEVKAGLDFNLSIADSPGIHLGVRIGYTF